MSMQHYMKPAVAFLMHTFIKDDIFLKYKFAIMIYSFHCYQKHQ